MGDIRKYAEGMHQTRIVNAFNHIPVHLAKDNKKFQISKVASGARFRDYRGCIEWLDDAGMINVCYCLNFPELPLRGNYDGTKYKLYFVCAFLLKRYLAGGEISPLSQSGNQLCRHWDNCIRDMTNKTIVIINSVNK